MISLNTHLNTIGISAAKGVDLFLQRDQVNATLPRSESAAGSQAAAETDRKQASRKQELTPQQQQQVDELAQIDRQVHQHEQAHISAGGDLITGGPNYSYTYGPDGKQYATGGEVGIDTAAEKKPEANIAKGQHIQAAALAPADPSPQDYQVASIGNQLEAQGRGDLIRQQQQERVAEEEAARQQRDAQAAASGAPAAEAGQAAATANQTGEQNPGDNRQLVQKAYATVAAGPAAAGRVSTFA